MERIEKPAIIITSLGRTGTKFFQVMLGEYFPNSTALHEPDIINFFQYKGWKKRIQELIKQGTESGFINLFIKKPMGKWSLVDVSDVRFQGTLENNIAVKRIYNMRKNFISRRPGNLYVEASIGYYGILDLLEYVFARYRGIYLIRDGRSWVRSHMNWGQMYGKGFYQGLLAHCWPTAVDNGQMTSREWERLSRFEKLCWAWANLNEYAISGAINNPNILIMRFEDLFISSEKLDYIEKIINHISPIVKEDWVVSKVNESILNNKIHAGTGDFPEWNEWSVLQKKTFHKYCDKLCAMFGYQI